MKEDVECWTFELQRQTTKTQGQATGTQPRRPTNFGQHNLSGCCARGSDKIHQSTSANILADYNLDVDHHLRPDRTFTWTTTLYLN